MQPLKDYDISGNQERVDLGKKLIKEGKVGCVILAGGQGTRLGASFPKGMMPVSVVRKKTLFQMFFEKTKAASRESGTFLPLCVMTSPLNHQETKNYLQKNEWFGLEEDQVDLFEQTMAPFLEKQGKTCMAPDGNGSFFKTFYTSGTWEKWHKKGVEYVLTVLIDNPLADPFDAELCGYHASKKLEVTLKCIQRSHSQEKVGVVVLKEGKIRVTEYTELPKEESPHFALANTSLFCFSMPFLQKAASFPLPSHIVHKNNLQKTEKYLFDILEIARDIGVLVYPRSSCFAPLKNQTGEASLSSVQKALQERDRQIFSSLSTAPLPERPFELDPAFYYPTPELIHYWRNKSLPDQSYIDPF